MIVWVNPTVEFINMTTAAAGVRIGDMKTNRTTMSNDTHKAHARAVGLGLLVALGLCLSGCGKPEAKATGSKDFTGVYTLASVDGKPVPASIKHDGVSIEVREGTFTINSDGTCSTKTSFVPPSGTVASREVSATYTREGDKLTMQWKGAGTTVGTVAGNTFTMNNEGMVLAYKK